MLQRDSEHPWVVLAAMATFGLLLALVLKPLPLSPPQPQMAIQPIVRFELPPPPAWSLHGPSLTGPTLSLEAVAG